MEDYKPTKEEEEQITKIKKELPVIKKLTKEEVEKYMSSERPQGGIEGKFNRKLILTDKDTGLEISYEIKDIIRRPYTATYHMQRLAGLSIPDDIIEEEMGFSPLWLDITNIENYKDSLRKALKGKYKFRNQASKFIASIETNFRTLLESVKNNTYKIDNYNMFLVTDRKLRVIRTPFFKDKVVQHMINNIVREIFEPMFIKDVYNCIRNKGTQLGIEKARKYQYQVMKKYKDPQLIKIDISKFFASIDHNILMQILTKYIKCPKTLTLLYKIVSSTESPGLPLGNLLSQMLSNVYLNEFDQYVKKVLKVKRYLRYADDCFIFVDGKEEAKRLASLCTLFLKSVLKLEANPKKTHIIRPSDFPCLGVRLRVNNIKLLGRNKKKLKKAIKEEKWETVESYKGLWKMVNLNYLINKYCKEFGVIPDPLWNKGRGKIKTINPCQ